MLNVATVTFAAMLLCLKDISLTRQLCISACDHTTGRKLGKWYKEKLVTPNLLLGINTGVWVGF